MSIEGLIAISFPRYKNKAVYALKTLIDIFNSEDVARYVENSIISAWDNAPDGHDMEYLEAFHQVNPDKALSVIKKKIEQEKYVDFDMRSFNVDSKKNFHDISTKEIGILRSIGASKRNISSIFNAETFIIGLLSGVFGVVISYILIIPINCIIF